VQREKEKGAPLTFRGRDTPTHGVYLMVKVVEHDGRALILLLEGLPRIYHQPRAGLLSCQGAHVHSASAGVSAENTA
jgi:hypothetical protein